MQYGRGFISKIEGLTITSLRCINILVKVVMRNLGLDRCKCLSLDGVDLNFGLFAVDNKL